MYLYFVACCAALIIFLYYQKNRSKDNDILTKYLSNKHWKENVEGDSITDLTVQEFNINIPDEDIQYLNHRLDITR